MKSMRLHEINKFTYDDVEKPVPKGEEILVRVGACGICGSDIPRVYELGTKVYPVIVGHEFSGTVVEVGDEKNKDLIGKTATIFPLIPCRECDSCKTGNYAQCSNYNYLGSRSDGGFAEYCLVPSKWNLVFSNNPDVSKEELSLVEPATVAQHALRKGDLKAGETVAILGAGPIGIMIGRWAKIFGAKQVILVDISDVKVKFAEDRGFKVINSIKEDCSKIIKELTNGRGADLVVEGTGSSGGINTAIECVKTFGRIALLGNPHQDTTIKLSNHSDILRKEITLIGVWNSYYLNTPINEWRYTVDMIDERKLELSDLITHKSSLKNLKNLFDDIYNKEITICKAIYSDKAK
ncbi:galactitol-1-phosphate 5-dehydrogenase [Clostridium sp.]|uniref:galactitol-1-phosphate 5-dehydrogenase n=1 Tax=Clostridium sp. TaxID=1506 RepID=UPI002911B9D4|nr:galactitol-1-phosphate 5-dehydrogenase [Clostridium sp.]MDU5107298.1 galactitol-1-phosphate 5-dehydrogenase [Clostridium sp.]